MLAKQKTIFQLFSTEKRQYKSCTLKKATRLSQNLSKISQINKNLVSRKERKYTYEKH